MGSNLDAYVDGSCIAGRYGWSFVIYDRGMLIYSDCGVGNNAEAAKMNNVAGELSAAMRAARWAWDNNKIINLHYDYEGVEKWVTGEWKAKKQFTKLYREFMLKYKGIVVFNKVKAHSGLEGNELADELARGALMSKNSF